MGQEWKLRLLIYRFTDLDPMKCKGPTFYIIKQISIYGSLMDLYWGTNRSLNNAKNVRDLPDLV